MHFRLFRILVLDSGPGDAVLNELCAPCLAKSVEKGLVDADENSLWTVFVRVGPGIG